MGGEKLAVQKFAEIASRQDALQTTLSVRLDIFYPAKFPRFLRYRVLPQQPDSFLFPDQPPRKGEVFNLFNTANLSGRSGDVLGFGQPTSRVTQVFGSGGPRAFQIAARVSF